MLLVGIPASERAIRKAKGRLRSCPRAATSGFTPPCVAFSECCESTTLAKMRRRESTTPIAVSSQLDSIPNVMVSPAKFAKARGIRDGSVFAQDGSTHGSQRHRDATTLAQKISRSARHDAQPAHFKLAQELQINSCLIWGKYSPISSLLALLRFECVLGPSGNLLWLLRGGCERGSLGSWRRDALPACRGFAISNHNKVEITFLLV